MANILQKKNKEGEVFCQINKNSKKGYYVIFDRSSQNKYCEKVFLEGFDHLPSGFYTRDGIGLTAAGNFIFQELFDKYKKKLHLTLVAKGPAKLDGRGKLTKVRLPHEALTAVNVEVRTTKRIRNEEIKVEVRQFLAANFATQFKEYKGATARYAGGTLAEALDQKGMLSRLSDDDREKLEDFIPEYLSSIKGTLKAKNKLKVVFDSLDAGKKVYFEKIINEFNQKLKRSTQSESVWQKFLSDYILVLRNTYGEVLEKESVSLQGKFPDFMLIDPYSYLDIYEIKKPTTVLLRFDKSRNNYYWDTEMSKAISQVENYIHQVQRSSDILINDIRKHKGIDVNIVRPRGYIIAGTRSQLKSPKMLDDFRILVQSLTNLDVILYDDLKSNLEAFINRIAQ